MCSSWISLSSRCQSDIFIREEVFFRPLFSCLFFRMRRPLLMVIMGILRIPLLMSDDDDDMSGGLDSELFLWFCVSRFLPFCAFINDVMTE